MLAVLISTSLVTAAFQTDFSSFYYLVEVIVPVNSTDISSRTNQTAYSVKSSSAQKTLRQNTSRSWEPMSLTGKLCAGAFLKCVPVASGKKFRRNLLLLTRSIRSTSLRFQTNLEANFHLDPTTHNFPSILWGKD